jgi:hypothetical protein
MLFLGQHVLNFVATGNTLYKGLIYDPEREGEAA